MRRATFHSAWITEGGAGGNGSASGVFPWWSFSKTVLAAAALRLVEEGRIDLDRPCTGAPYSLRQLLQHRAGVPDYGALAAYHEAVARNDPAWSRARLLAAVGGERLDFAPGTGWAYSNVGYMFVREAIEAASGLPLAAALHDLVLSRLDVPSVGLAAPPCGFAEAFWPELRSYDPAWVYHGCLTGTPGDAARVLHGLLTGAVLKPESLRAMLNRHDLGGAVPGRPWTRHGYGLGLMTGAMGEAGRAIGHSGGGPLSGNAVYHFPDAATPVSVAVFADARDEGLAESEAAAIALRAMNQ